MTQTVLILGASGRFGGHAAQAFEAAGWQVRRFARGGDLNAAAAGADVIVNGWNPAYPDWERDVPGLTRQVIDAARVGGATVIVPGNVYVYGPDMPAIIGPGVAHRAENPLGRVRREMEAAYRAAGLPVIVLRAGDFIDTEASGNWFDMIMAKGVAKGRFVYPGRRDIPHAFAFLPDLARVAVRLAEMRAELPVFSDLAYEGYTLTGQELADLCGAHVGRRIRVKRFNWPVLRLMQPVWSLARLLLEMRYLWDTPHALDGTELARLLPDHRATPAVTAIGQSLAPILGEPEVHPHKAVA